MREIYNRDPYDKVYNPDQLEITDPVDICVGQLKMLLLTNKGEVLGDPKFGLGLEALVYDMKVSEYSLRKELDLQLSTYCPLFSSISGTYDLKFYLGTERDIVLIDFSVPVNGNLSPVITLKLT